MKKLRTCLAFGVVCLVLTATGLAGASGPDIRVMDNKISVQADAIPLSRLLRLFDEATGMTSKVPPELANRNVSVRFQDLSFDEAVHKIFEGQPLDYVVVQGKGIIVTGASQTMTARNSSAPAMPAPAEERVEENPAFMQQQQQMQQMQQQQFAGQPGIPGMQAAPGVPGAQNQQPAMIQTPFGALPNPRANQPATTTGPATMPGANNPFNSSLPGFNTPSQVPTLQSTPAFGGAPNTTPPPNSPFGNSPFGSSPGSPSTYPNTVPNNGFPGATPTQPRPNP